VIQIGRLRLQPAEEVVAVAIILVEEQTRGWLAAIVRSGRPAVLASGKRHFRLTGSPCGNSLTGDNEQDQMRCLVG
jgi:hypothetical protein